ncbi:MerR family transcriptional regulator [Streptomyces sp. NPDC046862]|uniref:MerR family transcriptional regulator n=1 Tax=Streptomyces sp. NPDC046862 TaxID=3154603 RepID=UPI0034518751
MNDESVGVAYRIEDLAHRSGATVRTIRAYQDRGLLPRPERRGRANVYSDAHLARLRQIADLLDRGYTLASIKELLQAWDTGRGLGGILGLVAEADGPGADPSWADGPWGDEKAARILRTDLDELFGGRPDDATVADAIELGLLEPVPGQDDVFAVPRPQQLPLAVELRAAGLPLSVLSSVLRELRGQAEHIASRFVEFTTEQVPPVRLGLDHPSSNAETGEVETLVRRLRPLARRTVDAELARATRLFAERRLPRHPGSEQTPGDPDEMRSVPVPAATMRAVERLVGVERSAEFVAIAAEREVQARILDSLATNSTKQTNFDEMP